MMVFQEVTEITEDVHIPVETLGWLVLVLLILLVCSSAIESEFFSY